MKVWELEQLNPGDFLDQYLKKIVVAKSSVSARRIANLSVGDEGYIWQDVDRTSCKMVKLDTEEGFELSGEFLGF